MEVVVPAVEFNLDNTYSSPYMTAPFSPQSFFFSAPTSPTRASSFAAVPKRKDFHGRFDKKYETNNDDNGEDFDFEFEFSGQFERTSLPAEKLFDGGKIRLLKPPPGFSTIVSSPKPRAFRKKDVDPFETSIEKSRNQSSARSSSLSSSTSN
ncbi:uncharacterized protein LOC120145251 [Hibiscus syriacus]|uniref:uncharacterized protein LOC120145251 n=1 Tax=Hibiscus syriacus TaxID=106335 RepID=UPI001921384F|nr:uncharacterized protein LOC120145251 [Hibiscus syriacus]